MGFFPQLFLALMSRLCQFVELEIPRSSLTLPSITHFLLKNYIFSVDSPSSSSLYTWRTATGRRLAP